MSYKNAAWIREMALIIGIVLLALIVRKYLLPIQSLDYHKFVSLWYDFIKKHGVQAFKYNFSNYNEPYLYLLAIATHLPLVKITAIKSISIFFDLVVALFVYLIVKVKYEKSYLPILAALIMLFLPSAFINSALWAQCDSIYTAFLLGSVYFLLRKKPLWAYIFFGIAFAFKFQAIFLLPLLFALWITGEIRFRYLLIIPLVYVIAILPAVLMGRNIVDLLTLYLMQANLPNDLSMNAPNLFLIISPPMDQFYAWQHIGVLLAVTVALILNFVLLASKKKLTNEIILRLALIFALTMPFFLPEMHERYFYLADILALIYAFYFPKYFYIAIIVEFCSLDSYIPFLMAHAPIELVYLVLPMMAVITLTIYDLARTLWPAQLQFKLTPPPSSSL